jgi:hypothetical protein
MPSQPDQPAVALSFARDEWEQLVTMPRRVLLAATAALADTPRRTVAEGLAGIGAIAAGHDSTSPLVREVVSAIYAAQETDTPAPMYADPGEPLEQTLLACEHVTDLLTDKAMPADATAYRQWLMEIASTVCAASHAGGAASAGSRIGLAENRFLEALAESLSY